MHCIDCCSKNRAFYLWFFEFQSMKFPFQWHCDWWFNLNWMTTSLVIDRIVIISISDVTEINHNLIRNEIKLFLFHLWLFNASDHRKIFFWNDFIYFSSYLYFFCIKFIIKKFHKIFSKKTDLTFFKHWIHFWSFLIKLWPTHGVQYEKYYCFLYKYRFSKNLILITTVNKSHR